MQHSLDLKSNWQNALSAANLSLRALAAEIGISHTYLSQIIAGKLPSLSVRLRLLEYFKDCRPEDLFGSDILPAKDSAVPCKRCHSTRTIKSGLFRGNQRFQCKDCGSVFIGNNAPFHGSLPVEAVSQALELFFAGEPLDSVRSLVQDSQSVSVTVTGLEKVVYRYARKAARLAGDILPPVHPRWVLDGLVLSGVRPLVLLDILDLDSGFIIASDVIRDDVAEKERESVAKKALRVTAFVPDILIMLFDLSGQEAVVSEPSGLSAVSLTPREKANLHQYLDSRDARTRIISRRLNFDTIANARLICEAWRVHYNYLSAFKPAGKSQFNCWLDIINAGSVTDA